MKFIYEVNIKYFFYVLKLIWKDFTAPYYYYKMKFVNALGLHAWVFDRDNRKADRKLAKMKKSGKYNEDD